MIPRALRHCQIAGKFLKPIVTAALPKGRVQHQGNDLGDGKSTRGC